MWLTPYNVWELSHKAYQWVSVIAGTAVRGSGQANAAAEAPAAAARPSRASASSSGMQPVHLLHATQVKFAAVVPGLTQRSTHSQLLKVVLLHVSWHLTKQA